jgi:tetratricopeptide (TPR) repeat protein
MTTADRSGAAEGESAGRVADSSPSSAVVLPPLQVPDAWPATPGVRLQLELVEPPPEPGGAIERIYAEGLAALNNDERLAALECFRTVVARDLDGTYSSARLLALLLSAELGDIASFGALLGYCMTNAQPDAFAQRAVERSELAFYWRGHRERPDIFVGECLDQPAITAQIALAGSLQAAGQTADAVQALEDGVPAWEARNSAWQIQERRIDTAARARETAVIDASAPRGPAGRLTGFNDTVCWLHLKLGDYDAALAYIGKSPRWEGSELLKALALKFMGLRDAALVVLDDCLRNPDSQAWANMARYRKAEIFLEQQDRQRARRELARVYADDHTFRDYMGLRSELDGPPQGPTQQRGRAAIPEKVRHVVWRRDEGRCVKCGSQENLEFDHVIPILRGGANTERNLQLLCEPCNRGKGATI